LFDSQKKNSKFDASRCQILRLKCTKFDFRWRSATDPAGGAYSAPPDPLAAFKLPTSKGSAGEEGGEGKGVGKGRDEDGDVKEGEGKEVERMGQPPTYFGLEASLLRPQWDSGVL